MPDRDRRLFLTGPAGAALPLAGCVRLEPTDAMIARQPELYAQYADGQEGGPTNPLGTRAIYLRTLPTRADEGIRIHGTPQWQSIGRRVSNGGFRAVHHDVIDLYDHVQNGAQVLVLEPGHWKAGAGCLSDGPVRPEVP